MKFQVDKVKNLPAKAAMMAQLAPLGFRNLTSVIGSFDFMMKRLPGVPVNDHVLAGMCAMAVIADNECEWKLVREWDNLKLPLSKYVYYAYDVFGYDKNSNLGNQGPFTKKSMNDDPIRFRGSFLCHLTGRYNFGKYLPLALPVLRSSGFRLNTLYESIISKDATALTNAQISALAANAEFSFAVLLAKCQHDSGLSMSDLVRSTDDRVDNVIAGYIRAIGYPKVRKVWPTGGYTPSRDDMCTRAARLYVAVRAQLIRNNFTSN